MADVSAAVAAAAVRAGVKRYWGDGPRPLNLPGAVPDAQWTGPRKMHVHGDGERGTVVLEPTPAQIERGERVLWIEQTSQTTAMVMLAWAREHGWDARLSRSRYLSAPTNAGDVSRRGRRLEVETVALRLFKDFMGLYLRWDFDVERARWSAGDALVYAAGGGRVLFVRPTSITAARVALGMVSAQEIEERKLEAARKREARKS